MFKLLFLISLSTLSIVSARSAVGHNSQNLQKDSLQKPSNKNGYLSDLMFLYKIYQECSKNDISTCLKIKLLSNLDKAVRLSKNVKLLDGLQFIKDDKNENVPISNQKYLSENDIEATLPRSIDEKDRQLNWLIYDKLLSFLRSHTLQIKYPKTIDSDSSTSEGRKKKKDNGAFVMIPLLLGGTFIPIAFGALSLLAGKALIVSKLALVLASIIGIKKLLSNGGGKESQHEVVVSGGNHGGSGWGRDFDLAYNGYAYDLSKDKPKDTYMNVK